MTAGVRHHVGSLRTGETATAFLLASILFSAGAVSTMGALDPDWMAAGGTGQLDSISWSAIVARNVGAALFMFSGCATGGITSAVGLLFLGMYMGATLGTSATGQGFLPLISEVGAYLPLELFALLLAGSGGLLPMWSLIRRSDGNRGGLSAYSAALSSSAVLLAGSVALLAVAAAIEHLLIHSRL